MSVSASSAHGENHWRQPLPVLHHRLDRLGVVAKGLFKFLSILKRLFSALGIHHGVKMPLGLNLLFLADRIHHIEHLVIPAKLLLGLGINLPNRSP